MPPIQSSSVTVSRPDLLTLAGRKADRRTVVSLRGEHDVATVAALSEAMARAIALDDADLVVDLSEVQFMGAATVGVIIGARELLRLRSRSLELRSPSTCAQRVLDLCRLADLLAPRPDDTTPLTRTAGALGTWVAVPATAPARSGRITTTREASSANGHHAADELPTYEASRGGP